QCHDITVYPALEIAGGACAGYGVLLDIHDPAHPRRIAAAADSNFAFWHSATFNNDGTKLLFTDEWGGGLAPKCRATDKREWGADAIFTVAHDTMMLQGYYKLPAPQTPFENCVAHNGSLIPVPGRDIMAQGWYQGGISVFDWTDPAHPKEIAYFDRGPMDSTKLVGAGSWSAYWYNGYIYSSEIGRGVINITTPPARDVVGTKLTLGGGELGTARADLRQAGVWLNGRLGYRVNLGYARSDDWTRSRTAKDSSDWKQEYARAPTPPPTSPGPERVALIGQTTDPATGQALGTPDPLVTVYGSARVARKTVV